MVGYKRPCITACICFGNDRTYSIQKIVPIRIIDKQLSPLDSSNDDVMECSRSIYAGFSWHKINLESISNTVNCKYVGRPQTFPPGNRETQPVSSGLVGLFRYYGKPPKIPFNSLLDHSSLAGDHVETLIKKSYLFNKRLST